MITLSSQNLSHVIDPAHTITNPRLDTAQQEWFYKVLDDIMISPRARTVVVKHKGTRNCRTIWQELCEAFDHSMSNDYLSQKYSNYMTSFRLKDGQWKGKMENYILHFKEVSRKYDETSLEPYTDGQKIQFLNASLAGVEPMASVLNIQNTAKQAAGITTKLTYEECINALMIQAQHIDAGNSSSRNPRVTRQVNSHELVFDDDEVLGCDQTTYDVNAHDMDTEYH